MKTFLVALAAGLFLTAEFVKAHHGWAAFDPKLTVTFKGTVTDFHFVNPHSVVEFEVKDGKGHAEQWQGELTSAARLAPKGWTAVSLEPGDVITVSGYRARTGVRVMRIMKIVTPKGMELEAAEGN